MNSQQEALPRGTLLDGRYELTGQLALDPDAEVYEGVDRVLARPVTVKVHRGTSPDERARFEREVHEQAARDRPIGDRVLDAGADGDVAYAVFDPRDGEVTTTTIATVPAPDVSDADRTQPIATDRTAELLVPPLLLEEPAPAEPVAHRWSARATRNVAIVAAGLVGVGALVLAAQNGPTAVDTPVAPSATTPDTASELGDARTTASVEPTTTTPTTVAPTTTAPIIDQRGFPFDPDAGVPGLPGKDKKKDDD